MELKSHSLLASDEEFVHEQLPVGIDLYDRLTTPEGRAGGEDGGQKEGAPGHPPSPESRSPSTSGRLLGAARGRLTVSGAYRASVNLAAIRLRLAS